MSTHQSNRIELTDEQSAQADEASDNKVSLLGRGTRELEKRITPLVVIAIIAILMALLVPAV